MTTGPRCRSSALPRDFSSIYLEFAVYIGSNFDGDADCAMRPIVLYRISSSEMRRIAEAVALAIGADVVALGSSSTSDFWGGLGLAFDVLARELPGHDEEQHQNFDLVIYGDHLPGLSPNIDPRASTPVRIFLRFHDDDREPIGLFVAYNEDLPVYPGQSLAAESVTVARGLTRIKVALGESSDGATPSPEAVHAVEAALRQRMVDRLV